MSLNLPFFSTLPAEDRNPSHTLYKWVEDGGGSGVLHIIGMEISAGSAGFTHRG